MASDNDEVAKLLAELEAVLGTVDDEFTEAFEQGDLVAMVRLADQNPAVANALTQLFGGIMATATREILDELDAGAIAEAVYGSGGTSADDITPDMAPEMVSSMAFCKGIADALAGNPANSDLIDTLVMAGFADSMDDVDVDSCVHLDGFDAEAARTLAAGRLSAACEDGAKAIVEGTTFAGLSDIVDGPFRELVRLYPDVVSRYAAQLASVNDSFVDSIEQLLNP